MLRRSAVSPQSECRSKALSVMQRPQVGAQLHARDRTYHSRKPSLLAKLEGHCRPGYHLTRKPPTKIRD